MGEVLRSETEGSQEQTRNYRGWFIKPTNKKIRRKHTLNVDSAGGCLSQKGLDSGRWLRRLWLHDGHRRRGVCLIPSWTSVEPSRSRAGPASNQLLQPHAPPLSPRQILITVLFPRPPSPTPDRWRRTGHEVITITSIQQVQQIAVIDIEIVKGVQLSQRHLRSRLTFLFICVVNP